MIDKWIIGFFAFTVLTSFILSVQVLRYRRKIQDVQKKLSELDQQTQSHDEQAQEQVS